MLNLKINTVPDDQQRYNTVGDYYINEKGERVFVISDMKDWRYELLTAIHELVESALCRHRGITDEEIDAYDLDFEQRRQDNDTNEPGNNPNSPYYREHQFADKIEKMLASELEVDWDHYCNRVDALMKNKEVLE